MATVDECEAAMRTFAGQLGSLDEETRKKATVERSVTCHLKDIGITFRAQLRDGTLQDIARTESPNGQIKLTMNSDDLLALVNGEIQFPKAWATGRVKIDANVFDLIRLRSLM
jgi:putative sterol carrier protein